MLFRASTSLPLSWSIACLCRLCTAEWVRTFTIWRRPYSLTPGALNHTITKSSRSLQQSCIHTARYHYTNYNSFCILSPYKVVVDQATPKKNMSWCMDSPFQKYCGSKQYFFKYLNLNLNHFFKIIFLN